MYWRVLNRLMYLYLPFFLLVLFYVTYRLDEPFDSFSEIDGFLILILPYSVGVVYQTMFFIERRKLRMAFLLSSVRNFFETDNLAVIQSRERILNIYLSSDERSLNLFKNNKLIFEYNSHLKNIRIISFFSKKMIPLNDIKIIVMEFDKILISMPRFTTEQSVYVCSYSIIDKNDLAEHLFDIVMRKKLWDNQDDFTEEDGLKKNYGQHVFFLEAGLKLLRILSKRMQVRYNYIDYVKEHSKNIIP